MSIGRSMQLHWIFFGASLKSWILFLSVFVSLYLSLSIVKKTILQGFFQKSSDKISFIEEFVIDVVRSTKRFFIFAWSIFAGAEFLQFSSAWCDFLKKAIFLITVFQIGIWCSTIITFWLEHSIRTKLSEDAASATTLGLVSTLTKFALYGLLTLLTLNHFGVDITALVAGLGVGGIAVALAVQNILSDLFASLTIVLDKPFVVGDSILTGDFQGTVERIGLKTTRIRSVSGEQLIFPNGDLLKSRIRNFKRMEERRMTFQVQVPYSTPHEKLKKVPEMIQAIIQRQTLTRFDRSTLKTFGTYGFEFETLYWVKDPELSTSMKIQSSINLDIVKHFRMEGIEFAYLHLPLSGKGTVQPLTTHHAPVGASSILAN